MLRQIKTLDISSTRTGWEHQVYEHITQVSSSEFTSHPKQRWRTWILCTNHDGLKRVIRVISNHFLYYCLLPLNWNWDAFKITCVIRINACVSIHSCLHAGLNLLQVYFISRLAFFNCSCQILLIHCTVVSLFPPLSITHDVEHKLISHISAPSSYPHQSFVKLLRHFFLNGRASLPDHFFLHTHPVCMVFGLVPQNMERTTVCALAMKRKSPKQQTSVLCPAVTV